MQGSWSVADVWSTKDSRLSQASLSDRSWAAALCRFTRSSLGDGYVIPLIVCPLISSTNLPPPDLLHPDHLQRGSHPSVLLHSPRNSWRRHSGQAGLAIAKEDGQTNLCQIRTREGINVEYVENQLPKTGENVAHRTGGYFLHAVGKLRLGNPLSLLLERTSDVFHQLQHGCL